ncbi:hypothetical protein [Desulfogranum marinum]|uniref:hypothetical protein n=1 Tax=Desulfogranum marinum TaxID=453220 RepID=UPI0019669D1E|nr:hypothetical protein [Desulfogranum marinum]MBM9515042.1 hypothetical protein [Desulfogranum marinum]
MSGKINVTRMLKMVNRGESQVNIAKKFGVTPAAICKKIQEVRGKTTHAVVADKIDKIADHQIDAFAQLEKINRKANELLDQAENDTHEAIKVMAEIRNQLKLQLELFQTLYSMQAAAEFQDTVLDVIGKVEPEVRKKIITELNSRSAIRHAVTFR